MDISGVILRKPTPEDGLSVYQLISQTPELDNNSCYCNLLQCSHFSDTSIIAEKQGNIIGFISGYTKPNTPTTLFIWQVAVSQDVRGYGLAKKMLQELINRDKNSTISHLEATITESNTASWALFNGIAAQFNAPLKHSIMFDRITHFNDQHDSELLVRIGTLVR